MNLLNRLRRPRQQQAEGSTVVDLPRETMSILRAGAEYADLVSKPGWKRLLDDLERRADVALRALRTCESGDPIVNAGLAQRWREAQSSLDFVQIIAGEAIERRRDMINEVSIRTGLDLNNDDTPEQRIEEFVMSGGKVIS